MSSRISTKNFTFGAFRLDTTRRLLTRAAGEAVPLTPKGFELLLLLVESEGRLLTKADLMNKMWPDSFVEEGNLTQTVSVLRKALGDNPHQHQYIVTVPGQGYQFIAPVREVFAEDEILEKSVLFDSYPSEIPNAGPPVSSPAPNPPPKPRNPRLLWLAVPLVVLLACGAYWFYPLAKPATLREIKTLAVLPFEDLSAEPTEKYLGVSLADALAGKFSTLKQITVRPTRTVLKYADKRKDIASIGRELQVDAVLDGRIQSAGGRVRVSVQLIRTADNAVLWTGNFDDQFTNFFAVQDSISQKVVQSLGLQIDEKERERFNRRGTENAEAYQDYLRGRFFWSKRTGGDFQKAIVQFEQAAQKDPNFALAFAGLADCYTLMPLYMGIPGGEAFPKALEYANKALQLDEQLAEVHTTLGYIKQHSAHPAEAEIAFKRAIELNPNYPTAHHWYSRFLRDVNRFDEALVEIKRANELDPTSVVIMINIAQTYKEQGNDDAAVEELKKALSFDPDFTLTHDELARVYLKKGLSAEALLEAQKAVNLSNRSQHPLLITLGEVYIKLGRRQEALAIIRELEEKYAAASSYYIASLYAQLGEKEKVFKWLERAVKEKHIDLLIIKDEPNFAPYRTDPRFQELVRQIGL